MQEYRQRSTENERLDIDRDVPSPIAEHNNRFAEFYMTRPWPHELWEAVLFTPKSLVEE